jgi:tight adherence protein C
MRLWPVVSRERLRVPSPGPVAMGSILRWDDAPLPPWRQSLERLGLSLRPRSVDKLVKVQRQLVWAGHQNPHAVAIFFGAKAAVGLGLVAAWTLYGSLVTGASLSLTSALITGVIGLFLPDVWLRQRVSARQQRIVEALPEVLDLLMVCVEAGMGFDAAVARVADTERAAESPLHRELMRMHLEIRAGRPREEAMRAVGERTGVAELMSITGAFIQAERLGTPLGKTLRVHAEDARVRRRHRAEERAQVAPLKMLFPTVAFLMPAFFLVAMAPALLGILDILGRLGR